MRQVLAILPLVPYPPDQGDRLRAWEMVSALSTLGALTVYLVTAEGVPPGAEAALRRLGAEVRVFGLSRWDRVRGAVGGGLTGRPPGITASWNDRAARALVAASQDTAWDVVCAFQLRGAPYALRLQASLRVLELTDALGLYRRHLPWRGRALRHRFALHGVEMLEARLPAAFTTLWISAAEDADWISARCGRRPEVVPNGCVPVDAPAPYRGGGPVLFLGNWRYPPNEDAALWFARQVWPAVHAQMPDRRLRLLGRPTPAVAGLGAVSGVEVAGYVPELEREWADASVVINPMRFGGGTSRKVLDAWAHARPVVSTAVGVRGLPCAPGAEVLLAETPADWRERLLWVWSRPEEAAALGRRGWVLARSHLRAERIWEAAVGRLEEAAST